MLPLEDEEISEEFRKIFVKRGIECHVETRLQTAKIVDGGVEVTVEKGGERQTLGAAMLLVAVGRAPYVEGLGAREAGIGIDDRGFVPVNDFLQTNVPSVYAIGDVVPSPQLAHVASAEAIVAAEHMAGRETRPVRYGTTPSCTYSSPEVASVGLSEAAARDAGYDVAVGKFPFSASGKARILDGTDGFAKVVSEKRYDEVLGVHLIGPRVTELIAEAGLMLQTECTTEEVARLMHAHPTLSETILEAAHGVHGSPIHI
jgi:dihydrolipoamide dehydrogenase